MKKYFEYSINAEIIKKFSAYYENENLDQHSINNEIKAKLKYLRLTKIVKFNKTDKILDVGCSRAAISKHLSGNVNSVVGIDVSKNIILTNKNDPSLKSFDFDWFDGARYNSKKKFDKILLLDVLEHSFEPMILLKNLKKTLKDNGKIIIQVPFTGWLSELVCGKYHEGHLRYYDSASLERQLASLGFRVDGVFAYNSVPFASKLLKNDFVFNALDSLVNMIPNKFYPYFGEIVCVASFRKQLDSH
jgi:SAM-dependent methyltransferase